MLVSRKGQQHIAELYRAGQGAKVKELVKQKDAKGLEATGLSRIDVLELLRAAQEDGIKAVFSLLDDRMDVMVRGDGTAGSALAATQSANKVPGQNNPTLQRMRLMTETKAEQAQKAAIGSLTKTLGAQVTSGLSFDLAEALVKLPPGQLDQAVARLHSLVGDKAALEGALGEAGWALQPRFQEPRVVKTTYFDTLGGNPDTSAVRLRQVNGGPAHFIQAKPHTTNGGVRQRVELDLSIPDASKVDLKTLLAGIAQNAPSLRPIHDVEMTLVSFTLQHEDGRSTIIDLESNQLTRQDGSSAKREDTIELSGSKAEIPSWPALLKTLGVRGEPLAPVASKGLAAAKALGLLD